jgi:transcriptional regulator with XRE-family HTH domain
MLLGHRLRCRRDQDELARCLGVSQATISNYEKGASLPPLDKISDLCGLLEIHGEERRSFVEEAYLAHAPDRIRALIADLRARVARLEAICVKYGLNISDT